MLLASNPDVEIPKKDGDTPLHRAVRNRNLEICQMLLEKRAKVSCVDRRGDTSLHIAMRACSKFIVEALSQPKSATQKTVSFYTGLTKQVKHLTHLMLCIKKLFLVRCLELEKSTQMKIQKEC